MPLIQFSEGDKLQAVVVEDAWYKSQITKIEGPKESKSGGSLNWILTFQIIEGKFMNKETDIMLNNKVSNASVLGTLNMHPHTDFMALKAAVDGKFKDGKLDLDSVSLQFDTDDLLNKPLDVKWTPSPTEEGGMINAITGFLPAGLGSSAAAKVVPF